MQHIVKRRRSRSYLPQSRGHWSWPWPHFRSYTVSPSLHYVVLHCVTALKLVLYAANLLITWCQHPAALNTLLPTVCLSSACCTYVSILWLCYSKQVLHHSYGILSLPCKACCNICYASGSAGAAEVCLGNVQVQESRYNGFLIPHLAPELQNQLQMLH